MSICFGDLVKVNGAVGISRVETHYSIAAVPGAIEALERLEMTAGQPAMDDDPVRVRARAALRAVRGEAISDETHCESIPASNKAHPD